jgi:L-rhamnose mutarotase
LAGLPRQAEWEAYVAKAQGADPSLPSHKKWRLMEKIFELEK